MDLRSSVSATALLALACSQGSSQVASGVGPADAGTDAQVTATLAICPDGTRPMDTVLSTECPLVEPTPGSCCGALGKLCPYAPKDDFGTPFALCVSDPQHPPFWQQTVRIDRIACSHSQDSGIVVDADGGTPCADRQPTPCSPQGLQSAQSLLIEELDVAVTACGGIPNESSIEVDYRDGCPIKAIADRPPSLMPPVDCLMAKLSSSRSGCALHLECAVVERSTLP